MIGRRRQKVEPLAVQFISGADLQGLKTVQHVKLGQGNAADPRGGAGLAQKRRVEPATTALAARGGAKLIATLTNGLSNLVILFRREGAGPDTGGVSLGNT